jgi:hypothetical protein
MFNPPSVTNLRISDEFTHYLFGGRPWSLVCYFADGRLTIHQVGDDAKCKEFRNGVIFASILSD